MLKPVYAEGIWGYAWSYQDENGSLVTAPFFAEAHEFSEGLAAVKFTCSWGYINESGEVVIPPKFDDASNFCEEFARVRIGSKHGFIDKSGEFTISPQFPWASDFIDGLAKVKIRAYRYGDIYRNYDAFLNKNGQILDKDGQIFDPANSLTHKELDLGYSWGIEDYEYEFTLD